MSAPQNPNIARASQSLTPGDMVELFIIDLSTLGVNTRFFFTNSVGVTFRGQRYTPLEVQASGFEYNGQGAFPQPKISIGNATRIMSSAAVLYQDLIGATLYRMKTYRQFCDDGASPDAEAIYQMDVYVFEQKTGHDSVGIEWTLSSAMDQEGRLLPGRVVLQNYCLWLYRLYNESTGGFDYSKVSCPYAGEAMFDINGEPVTDPRKDRCGRRVTDCKKRFGADAALPYGGFPGVARARV